MRLILGIGNPGREYEQTRHNLGFAVVEALARRHGATWSHEKRFKTDLATWESPSGRVLLLKPRTFVNLSGETAQGLLAFHKLPPSDLLVVVDDLNLPTGHLRLRDGGSAGGHNGLRDIEARIGQNYPRLRCGCGPMPAGADQVDFVLGGFRPDEREDAAAMIDKAAAAAAAWVSEGVVIACKFNGPLKAPPPRPKPDPASRPAPAANDGRPLQSAPLPPSQSAEPPAP
jgi:PTH1 family peptidyl-tRNA hydrolase